MYSLKSDFRWWCKWCLLLEHKLRRGISYFGFVLDFSEVRIVIVIYLLSFLGCISVDVITFFFLGFLDIRSGFFVNGTLPIFNHFYVYFTDFRFSVLYTKRYSTALVFEELKSLPLIYILKSNQNGRKAEGGSIWNLYAYGNR